MKKDFKKNDVLLTASLNNVQTLSFKNHQTIAFVLPSEVQTRQPLANREKETCIVIYRHFRVHERYLLKPFN